MDTTFLDCLVDLRSVPFTTIGSRLLVYRDEADLVVYESAYERPEEASTAARIRLADDGEPATVRAVTPAELIMSNGASLTLTPAGSVVLTHLPAGCTVSTEQASLVTRPGDAVVLERGGGWPADPGLNAHLAPEPELAEARDAVVERTRSWMARCPRPHERWQEMVRQCWWTLGVNTVVLETPGAPATAVVPSKIGYLGAWQWDSYFIALGLAWGDPQLAAEQLRLAVRYQRSDGQLPDVAHDGGVLASSADLPPADLARLRELASPSLDGQEVPLTKPPLLALAVDALASHGHAGVRQELGEAVRSNLRWWYEHSSRQGLPCYLHPYSSGLDDSPVFDDDALVASPDLASYLIASELTVARWEREDGAEAEAHQAEARAQRLTDQLVARWDPHRKMFPAQAEDGRDLAPATVVSLMPLLVPQLPQDMVEALVHDLTEGGRFATRYRIATVAIDDPSFSRTRMWRGPVWVNTSWLVCQGLRRHGYLDLARQIEDELLALVASAGPCEYFTPDTGQRADSATVLFGWSAALAIDIAMRRSQEA
ncbi:MAG: hypothetical protein E7K79_06480 [Actinomyces urogenitalis]|nr:hypothetical protein [Actinomyces urogenitalis]